MRTSLLLLLVLMCWGQMSFGLNYNPNYYSQIGDPGCEPDQEFQYDWADDFQMLDEQNNKPFVGSASWYYDPETPGIGLSMTVQQSVHSPTGYFAFGVFYTYNEDGSQAWYPVDGPYEPTFKDEDAYWLYDNEFFGVHVIKGSTLFYTEDSTSPYLYAKADCWWGHDNTYMGELSSPLAKTANGPVVDGAYSPLQFEQVGDVRLRWLNPDKVEIYIDGAASPQHIFIRHKFNSGAKERNADFLLENTYYFNTVSWGTIWKKFLPCWDDVNDAPTNPEMGCLHVFGSIGYKGVVEFKRFDHRTDMPNNNTPGYPADYPITATYPDNLAAQQFHRKTGWVPRHVNYISKDCMPGRVDFTPHSPLATPAYDAIGFYGVNHYWTDRSDNCIYLIMNYDPDSDVLTGYYAMTWYDDNDVSRGLGVVNGGYMFKAPLPQSDSALINLFPTTGWSSNNNTSTRDFTMNRSHFTLHRLPKLGGLFKQLPNIYADGWNLEVNGGE